MRLLVVTHNWPRFAGDPAGAFVARLAAAAHARGTDVTVLTPHVPRAARLPPGMADADGFRVVRFRYAPERLERVGYTGSVAGLTLRRAAPAAALLPPYLFRFRGALRRLARDLRPDVIHAHWWLPSGWLASGTRTPWLVTCHGSDVRLLERSALARALARRVLRRAAAVTTVSRFLADDLRSRVGAWLEPVVTPMPVDVALFSGGRAVPKADPPRILYAGNLVPAKGVDVLLHAVAGLGERGIPCELKILGEGPALPALRDLAGRLRLERRVTWSPFVPQASMPGEYGAATVTVLPSRGNAEGLGLVLVEALLAGSAVVGTPAGGIPEVIIHERTGLLARDGDAGDLADQLARLLGDAPLRRALTEAGQAQALETHAPEAALGRFWQLYDDLARRPPR